LFFKHFLKLLLTLHYGNWAASSKARDKRDATQRRNQLQSAGREIDFVESPAGPGGIGDMNHDVDCQAGAEGTVHNYCARYPNLPFWDAGNRSHAHGYFSGHQHPGGQHYLDL
jgi:hypothetical protein